MHSLLPETWRTFLRILLVDDAPDKLALIKSLVLSRDGGADSIEVAECGLDARERLAAKQFDLLLVDIALPFREGDAPDVRGGLNLLVELERSSRFFKPPNVLALTGYPELRVEFEQRFNNGVWSIDLFDPADSGWRDRLQAKLSYLRAAVRQSQEGSFDRDVVILTALASPELDFVRRIPWGFGHAESFDSVAYKYSGLLESGTREFSVDALAAPRMGMVAAATLASKVIQRLRPRLLIMAGICAGLPGEAELGDIIVADPTWDWQMGKYTLDSFEIQPDQIGAPLEVTQRFAVLRDDRHSLLNVADAFLGEKPSTIPAIRIGPMPSGSAVIASSDLADAVRKQNRKLVGFDMEMYGVYSAARDAAEPRPLVFGLKGVCDHADHYKNDKFQAYASHVAAGVLRIFLERYLAELVAA